MQDDWLGRKRLIVEPLYERIQGEKERVREGKGTRKKGVMHRITLVEGYWIWSTPQGIVHGPAALHERLDGTTRFATVKCFASSFPAM